MKSFNKRVIWKLFGILDFAYLLRFGKIIPNLLFAQDFNLEEWVIIYTMALNVVQAFLLLSLAITGFAFLTVQRWASIVYYFQFPFRVIFMTLTFGFITYANILFQNLAAYYTLLGIALVLEVVRLAIVIRENRSLTIG